MTLPRPQTALRTLILIAGVALAGPVLAADSTIVIEDPYARASGPTAKAGAAFLEITNTGDSPDRLVSATSPAAERVQLHSHEHGTDGVIRMVHVHEGFELAPGETLLLSRGGNHVMFMGLTAPFEQGKTIPVTLVFEKAGEVRVEIPVDLERE